MTPRDARVNLGDDFFDDVQSCSSELANLEDVCSLPFLFIIIFFSFVTLVLISME